MGAVPQPFLGVSLDTYSVHAGQLAAAQEDVDIVGISILSGAHLRLIPRLVDALQRHGLRGDDAHGNVMLLVGGTIPDCDVERLREMGVDGVFPVGTFTGEMVEFIGAGLAVQDGGTADARL